MISQKPLFTKLRAVGSYLVDPKSVVSLDKLTVEKPVNLTKAQKQEHALLGTTPPTLDSEKSSVTLHSVVDTEFRFTHSLKDQPLKHSPREPLTTQIMHAHELVDNATVIAHKQHAHTINAARVKEGLQPYPISETDVDLIDYLRLQGYDVKLCKTDEDISKLPVFEHCIYGHFLLAELFVMHRGEFAADLLGLVTSASKTKVGASISMNRRLAFTTGSRNGFQQDRILLPWKLTLEGHDYRFALAGFDTSAIHGVASYDDLLEATEQSTAIKRLLTKEDKSDILNVFITRPVEAELYAKGDLLVYQALVINDKNFRQIYFSLGVDKDLHTSPKMTIGSTVLQLFDSVVKTKADILDSKTWELWKERLMTPASAAYLRSRGLRTTTLMSKVQGGRCRNNRPNIVNLIDAVLADMDIDGAYGEGQRNQLFPVGKPESLYDYELDSEHKHYYTLREALLLFGATQRTRKHKLDLSKLELVPGLFFMLVSTLKPLEFMQDFFCSWYADDAKSEGNLFHKMQQKLAKQVANAESDTEREQTDQVNFNEEDGELKIHLREIINGVLTWDGLQWILETCSPKQRDELLDNLRVNECLFYSVHNRVDDVADVIDSYSNWKKKTTATRIKDGRGKRKRVDDGECHTWCAFNLGELIIDALLCNRKLYAKKTPMNTLYKLCVNTLYGDMVSKHFTSANVIVGNNITARCRMLAWVMEHGLHGFETVTDGTAFDLNNVPYAYFKDQLFAEDLTMLWTERDTVKNRHIRLAPLAGYKHIRLTWADYVTWDEEKSESKTAYAPVLTLVSDDDSSSVLEPTFKNDSQHPGCQKIASNPAMTWVNIHTFKHLRRLFPGLDVLHKHTTKVKPRNISEKDATPKYYRRLGQFAFEAKDFYESITVKGTSDYSLNNPNGSNIKMRSHELKKQHVAMDLSDDYAVDSPGKQLMNNIRKDPTRVERLKPAVKDGILKLSDFDNRREYYSERGLVPGDQIRKPMMVREFSLTQFTFHNRAQYLSWKKAIMQRKENYGQSLEAYFCNNDGTLNFRGMIAKVSEMVYKGVENPFEHLDPNRNQRNLSHPYNEMYQEGKRILNPGKLEFTDEAED